MPKSSSNACTPTENALRCFLLRPRMWGQVEIGAVGLGVPCPDECLGWHSQQRDCTVVSY